MNRQLLQLLLLLLPPLVCCSAVREQKVQYFPLKDIELLDSPFKKAQDKNKEYLLAMNPDRLLAPFRREAGMPLTVDSYTNWENTGLDGHIGGHYLSALSYMYASTGDSSIFNRLSYMVNSLKEIQEQNGNGYIGGVPGSKKLWEEIAAGNIEAARFRLNGKWVPLYNIHKTFAGLRDVWVHTKNTVARDMLIQMTDWMYNITAGLTDEQIQNILLSEHGGLNEVFADVALITGDNKYLTLAQRFSHRELLNPLLEHHDCLTGMHANTQIPKVLGFKRVSDVEQNQQWRGASQYFWERVTEKRSVSIGGNSVHEHFNPIEDFLRMVSSEQGPETCNTYNMLRLTMMLNTDDPMGKYSDYYERALYNHILSTQNPYTGGLVYFTPMRPAHYRVYSQPETSMWCCVGSGIENHSRYGEMIYAYTKNKLYINLFIPSALSWEKEGIELIQTNNFPEESQTRIVVNPSTPKKMELKIRYPQWTNHLSVRINGEIQKVEKGDDGYISLNRKWKKGDEILVDLPMHLTIESFPDYSNFRSIVYGPVVLASRWGVENMDGLFADDSRGGHIAHGPKIPFSEIPTVTPDKEMLITNISSIAGKPLHFNMKTSSGEVELEPFYNIHENRYIIYWPTEIIRNPAEALSAATIDMVYCGEQQPESDHFIIFENSEIGYSNNKHWRKAKEWFSYELKNTNKKGHFLQVSYIDDNIKSQASISVNGKVVKNISTGKGVGKEISNLIHLTSDVSAEKLLVKVAALNGFETPLITEIRILSTSVIEE